MPRFVEGEDRAQSSLFPERLDEYIAEDNPVRLIDTLRIFDSEHAYAGFCASFKGDWRFETSWADR